MALKGKLTWKGLDVNEAYAMVDYTTYNVTSEQKIDITPATYNEDGSVKTEEVTVSSWVKVLHLDYNLKVYSDKDHRDDKPHEFLYSISGKMTPKVNNSAKNFIVQVYDKLKLSDEYKHMADL